MIAITLQAIADARRILFHIARKQKKQNSSTHAECKMVEVSPTVGLEPTTTRLRVLRSTN